VKVGGVASEFATAVPNSKNGGNQGFLMDFAGSSLVAIAKHW
jgi:hypothetical protein